MKTYAQLTTIISIEDIDKMIISRAREAISEDLRLYPDQDEVKVTRNENGDAIVSFQCETEH